MYTLYMYYTEVIVYDTHDYTEVSSCRPREVVAGDGAGSCVGRERVRKPSGGTLRAYPGCPECTKCPWLLSCQIVSAPASP